MKFRGMVCTFFVALALPCAAWQANLTLVDEGTICDGSARVVGIDLDLTGVTTSMGPAGLNAFAVSFLLANPNVRIAARPGAVPALDWSIEQTTESQMLLTSSFTVVGWVADTTAPNTSYRLATLVISGSGGELVLDVDQAFTSFGSRSMGSAVAENITYLTPPPLIVDVPNQSAPALGAIIEAWQTDTPAFDVSAPSGLIDVADLTQLITCGSS